MLSNETKQPGRLIIISGPSGAGKSSVVSKAVRNRDDFCFSVSVTTRQMREGETEGKDYFFISEEKYDEMVASGALLEHARYVSHGYGTPKAYVEQKMAEGCNVLLDIEIQGARQVSALMPDALRIFIVPPSMEELRKRLINRGTDSLEVIDARIARAREEYREADFYDYIIINDDLDLAAEEFSAIILAESCRYEKRSAILRNE